jgi:hypothetical protein
MYALPRSSTSSRPGRIAVAVVLIAALVLLTASVSAFLCGPGAARDVEPAAATSDPEPAEPQGGLVGPAVVAAENIAMSRPGFELGVAMLDTATGERALSSAGANPMFAASITKLVVVVDMIDRQLTEGLVVSDADRDMIRAALGPSDDLAMNELWTRFDGQGAIGRVSARLGLTATYPPTDPSYWGEMATSPDDLVRIYEHVLTMPPPERDLILGAMESAPPIAADGFAQDFGLLAPGVVTSPIVKQGWMCCFDQTAYLHSVGLVGEDHRFVVATMSRQPYDEGWMTSRDGLTSVATAIDDVLSADDVENS